MRQISDRTSRATRGAKRHIVRRLRSPFGGRNRPLIVHCSHHKAGTVWLFGVLRTVALRHGMYVVEYDAIEPIERRTDVALFRHSRDFTRGSAPERTLRGSHMVRDPRDLAVSAYFYHLRTAEQWVHAPREEYGGRSYQTHLRSLSHDEGLQLEIDRLAQTVFHDMAAWDYQQADFLELKYEDLLADERRHFSELFRFYGFSSRAANQATDTALELGRRARSHAGGDTHIRSGKPGEWREHLTGEHVERIKQVAGDLIVRLGYESTSDWSA